MKQIIITLSILCMGIGGWAQTNPKIARLVDEIDKDSAIVTDLLDQLIEVSLRDSGNEHYSKPS
jgi:hypothetical protein